MRLKTLPILLGTLFCVLTFAIATSGFAHRFVSPAQERAEIYAAAFGLVAEDLCAGSDKECAKKGCDACRLMTAFHLPDAAPGYARLSVLPALADADMSAPRLSSLTGDTARPARAPPLA